MGRSFTMPQHLADKNFKGKHPAHSILKRENGEKKTKKRNRNSARCVLF